MDKLRNGRFRHQMATADEVKKTVEEIKMILAKYGWGDKKVMPYGYGIKLDELVKNWEDFERCTIDSQQIIIDEINGTIEHALNHWLELEAEPQITVKLINGKTATVAESIARQYKEMGLAV